LHETRGNSYGKKKRQQVHKEFHNSCMGHRGTARGSLEAPNPVIRAERRNKEVVTTTDSPQVDDCHR